jgi:hypothetical protein
MNDFLWRLRNAWDVLCDRSVTYDYLHDHEHTTAVFYPNPDGEEEIALGLGFTSLDRKDGALRLYLAFVKLEDL